MSLLRRVRPFLTPRDWAYLASLLVPLALYKLALKTLGLASREESLGLIGALNLARSDLLFSLGFAVLWVGLFSALRSGWPRKVTVALLHVSTALIVVLTTCAYQYFETTGSSLDYEMVTFYLASLGEVQGAISSEAPAYIWVMLAGALVYAVLGPWLVARLAGRVLLRRRSHSVNVGDIRPQRAWARRDFVVAGLSAAAGLFFINRSLLSGGGAFSRDPVSNLLATGMQEARADAAAEGLEVANPLARARLKSTSRTRRRNVVLIHLESTRERSVTPYNPDLQTMPFLDELAENSLLVERSYTTTPHTSKAVTAINSGLYSHPDTDIIEAQPGALEARCLPELLRDHGYRTAWFQSATEEFENRRQQVENFGYEHFEAIEQMQRSGFEKANYLGYEDDIMLEPSRRWLREDLDSPSFTVYLGVTPHHQYLAPAGRYGREHFSDDDTLDRYLNSIRYDDFFTENVINLYKDLGLYENTIFVIYGDHGEAFGEHNVTGHDGVVYEEGLRVPLVIHDPQRFAGGRRAEGPANLLDFAPTLVDLLGYEVVDGEYPGSSLARPLPEDRTLMFSCRPDLLHLASIKGHEKFVHNYDKKPDELYDLAEDPLELRNRIDKMSPGEREERRAELLDWRARTIAMYEGNTKSNTDQKASG